MRKFDGYNMGAVDASIVATHMMLQAAELDLGTTWVGHFDPDKIKQLFELPNDIIPNNVFPLGYPAQDSQPSARHTERKALKETVQYL